VLLAIYTPAVKAADSIFTSLESSLTVKRVVFTSSFVAMIGKHESPYTYDEKDWNDNASKMIKEMPDKLPGVMLYLAAKTDGERIAWDVCNILLEWV